MLLPLASVGPADVARVGRKAAALGALARAGFPVPPGLVLPVGAVPPDWGQALALAGGRLLAVRSSGVAEDLAEASYAGRYETVLNVAAEPDALAAAVERVRVSAVRAEVYAGSVDAAAAGGPYSSSGDSGMAVLIQPMVAASAAGVAFTAHPVTGVRDVVLVEAVRGTAERLVGGEVSPDVWVATGGGAPVCRAVPRGALDAAQVVAVVALARAVADFLGGPQDIEWALEGERPVLLQARPITALPAAAPADRPEPGDFWQRAEMYHPEPLSPLHRSVYLAPVNAGFAAMCTEYGLLLRTLEVREFGGWAYIRPVPFSGPARGPAPDEETWREITRSVPRLRDRIASCVAAMRADLPGGYLRRWESELRPGLAARIAALRDTDLAALPDPALLAHADAAVELLRYAHVAVHYPVRAAITIALGELAFCCRDLLGWDETAVAELTVGLSTASTEPARRVAAIAWHLRQQSAAVALLADPDPAAVERLGEVDPELAAAWSTLRRELGCRALACEVAEPTLAERPNLLVTLLRAELHRPGGGPAEVLAAERAAAVGRARSALAGRPGDAARFERALARAQQAYPIREDNQLHTVAAPVALIRYAALEAGRRLAGRGQLAAADDVFALEYAEVVAALRGGQPRHDLVAARRAEAAAVRARPGPATYGDDPGGPPSWAVLPPEARLAMESLLWMVDSEFTAELHGTTAAAGPVLRGTPASPGRHTGPVRVVRGEAEFGRLRPGDVLVCRMTTPAWSVLFGTVGALVTDTGGVLSHPAIIAREHRIPAVVATGNATGQLRDGAIVTVDGAAGTVETAAIPPAAIGAGAAGGIENPECTGTSRSGGW
jgi:rifampicin phosphotransferase